MIIRMTNSAIDRKATNISLNLPYRLLPVLTALEWLDHQEARLLAIDGPDPFLTGLRMRGNVARACFDLLVRHNVEDKSWLVAFGLTSEDLTIARRSCEMTMGLGVDEQVRLLREAMSSPFVQIRTRAVRALFNLQSPEQADLCAVSFLDDRQGAVRDAAAVQLKARGFNVRGHYLELLLGMPGTTAATSAALSSLARHGLAADAAVVQGYGKALAPAVRLSAFSAWIKLRSGEKDEVARVALADTSARVRRFAERLCLKSG
jgi:HEAT repeat protein